MPVLDVKVMTRRRTRMPVMLVMEAIWGIVNTLASSTALVWGIEDGKSPTQLRTYGAERVQHPI